MAQNWTPRPGLARARLDTPVQASLSTADTLGAMANAATPDIDFLPTPTAAWAAQAVNTACIAQDTVTTAPNGDLYAVWWSAAGDPIIGCLPVNSRQWSTYNLAWVIGNPLFAPVQPDSHCNIVIGIDGNGFLHVAANMHNNTLRYVKSTAAYALTSWSAATMIGTQETYCTYPQFVRLANGDLLFFYRLAGDNTGGAGNGDTFLNRYAINSSTWTRVTQIFKGTAPVNPTMSAYINRVALGADGTLHVFYLWRDTGGATTNHDISYVKSTDGGVTWKTAAGAAQTLPIVPTNTAPTIISGYPAGLINQPGASVDTNGVPHAFWWLTNGSNSELHHLYYSGGSWRNDVVATQPGTWVSRASSFSPSTGETYALYARGGLARALRVSPSLGTEVTLSPYLVGTWEPTFDVYGTDTTLRLMMAPAVLTPGQRDGTAGVLAIKKSVLDGGGNVVHPRPQPAFVPTSDPPPVGGSPMTVGGVYLLDGVKVTTAVVLARGSLRAGQITPARRCVIDYVGVRLTAAGGAGSTYKVVVLDAAKATLIAATANQDGTVTGNLTIPFAFNLAAGVAVWVGILVQNADTTPSFGRLEGATATRLGHLVVSQALDPATAYVGITATGLGDGAAPASIAGTYNLTSAIPNVVLHVAA